MLGVITAFMFVCLPLLLLDLYSWVPLTRVEEQKKRQELSHTRSRKAVKDAIRQNASLVEWKWNIKRHLWSREWTDKLKSTLVGRWIYKLLMKLCPLCSALQWTMNTAVSAVKKCSTKFVLLVKLILRGITTPLAVLLCRCCGERVKDRTSRAFGLVTLIPWAIRKCKLPPFDQSCDDYLSMTYSDLISHYGFVRLILVFFRLYLVFMTRSIGRALGAFLGWRGSARYMHMSPEAQSRLFDSQAQQKKLDTSVKTSSRTFKTDKLCLRFNLHWKLQYIKDKVVMPLINVSLVSGGIWGENQWKEFGIEPRANDCYKDEPSGEIKQLQTMALHGKIVSLFWLCVPNTLTVAYLAEVLNRGPILAYFVNKKFLQADFPESERDKDPVWRFLPSSWFCGNDQEGVVYLTNTSFFNTTLRWLSAIGELVALFRVQYEEDGSKWLKVALWTTAVTPTLELLQQARNVWVEFVELNDGIKTTRITIPTDTVNAMGSIQSTEDDEDSTTKAGLDNNTIDQNRAHTKQQPSKVEILEAVTHTESKRVMTDASNLIDNLAEKFGVSADLDVAKSAAAKKKLVLLRAMPEMNYVVLADALDRGEGEVTVSWKVNARQRFHALDAIGLFPIRLSGNTERRTMDQCICYRLLKHSGASEFGWKQKTVNEAEEANVIQAAAQKLFSLTRNESQKLALRNKGKTSGIDEAKNRISYHHAANKALDDKFEKQLKSSKVKPGKKLTEALQHAAIALDKTETKITSIDLLEEGTEEDRKEDREVVSGEVKFRPANNSLDPTDEEYDAFIYGNDAGIYPPKYGLQSYEFCYLRYNINSVQHANGGTSDMKLMSKVRPKNPENPLSHYEVLDLLPSNTIKIGTFNLFMNLTCDQPLVGPGKELRLTWTINGVNYDTLALRECQNCIGFYRVSCVDSIHETATSAGYAKIEVIPTSAYIKADRGKPCSGRMVVTTPSEPGMYEIRFLFNYFKDARLHRQCQVFGDLEDEMQVLRIRSFYEKHSVTDALNKFNIYESKKLEDAHSGAREWLIEVFQSVLDEPVPHSKKASVAEYSELLLQRAEVALKNRLESESRVAQKLLRCIVRPLAGKAFLDVLLAALSCNTQASDQLNSIVFPVATDEDLKEIEDEWINPYYKRTLLPVDSKVRKAAGAYRSNLTFLALEYLHRESLCGFHDLVDDIVLTYELLLTSVDQILNDLASSCITLYETPIREAINKMVSSVKDDKCKAALRYIDPMLIDLCRSHLQQIVRAFLETDHNPNHCGLKWELPPCEEVSLTKDSIVLKADERSPESKTSSEEQQDTKNSQKMRIESLRKSLDRLKRKYEAPLHSLEQNSSGGNLETRPPERDSLTPVTLQHIAVRRWVVPLLTRKIVIILRQRYARAASKSIISPSAWWPPSQFLPCTTSKNRVETWGFPPMWSTSLQSPLYFLGEAQRQKLIKAAGSEGSNISNQEISHNVIAVSHNDVAVSVDALNQDIDIPSGFADNNNEVESYDSDDERSGNQST